MNSKLFELPAIEVLCAISCMKSMCELLTMGDTKYWYVIEIPQAIMCIDICIKPICCVGAHSKTISVRRQLTVSKYTYQHDDHTQSLYVRSRSIEIIWQIIIDHVWALNICRNNSVKQVQNAPLFLTLLLYHIELYFYFFIAHCYAFILALVRRSNFCNVAVISLQLIVNVRAWSASLFTKRKQPICFSSRCNLQFKAIREPILVC